MNHDHDDEARRLQEIERGRRADAVLNDPLLVEAFGVLETAFVAAWSETGFRQDAERTELWRRMQTLKKLRGHLETVMQTGRLAKAQLDELRGVKRFGIF